MVTAHGNNLSGDTSHMAAKFKRSYRREISGAQVRVPCRPLTDLIDAGGLTRQREVTFLSVDVEGSEVRVLETVDLTRFDVVLIELDGRNRAKDEHARALMRNASMVRAPGFPRFWTDELWVSPRGAEAAKQSGSWTKHHVMTKKALAAKLGFDWSTYY